jgi:hypothetical protein
MSEIHDDARNRKNDGRRIRGSRSDADDVRTNDMGTAFTEAELEQMIRSEFIQEALPSIPSKPGMHRCWLSTMSSHDPIHKRMRLGYRPVSMEDVAGLGLDQYRMTSGEFAGAVACNEMVLFEIPQERYELIMRTFHHTMPLEEEQGIRAKAQSDEEDRRGKRLVSFDDDDEGFSTMGREPRAPSFS